MKPAAFNTPNSPTIVEDVWTLRLAKIGAWVIFVLCGYLAAKLLTAEQPDPARAVANAAISAVGLLSLVFLHLNQQQNAVRTMILGGWAAVTLLVSVSGGIYSHNVIVYPLLILLSGYLLGSRTSALLTGLSIGAALVFAVLHYYGALPAVASKPLTFPLSSFLATVVMSGLGTWYFNRSLEDHVARQREEASARVLAERIADQREQQLLEIANNIPGVIFQFFSRQDGTQGFYFVSPSAQEVFGIAPELPSFLGNFLSGVHPDDVAGLTKSIQSAVETSSPWCFEGRFLKQASDGASANIIWFRSDSSPVRHDHEMVFSGILTDISISKDAGQKLLHSNERYETLNAQLEQRVEMRTAQLQDEIDERKKIETALRDTANRLQQIIDTIDSGLLVWSPTQTLQLWNEAFTRVFPGVAPTLRVGLARDVLGEEMRTRGGLISPDKRAAQWDALGKFEVNLPDGRTLEVNRIETRNGGRLVMHNDVTELRQHREALTRNERMAALGSLVAGVAHEINTPLGNALMVTTTLEDHLKEFDQARQTGPLKRSTFDDFIANVNESAHQLHRNLQRSAELIQHFKQVAVDQTSDRRREFNLASVLGDISATVAARLRKAGHHMHIDCPDDLSMDSYPGAIGQIVTNLIENSILHGFDSKKSGHLSLSVTAESESIVLLNYSDDGVGIPKERLPRIFDPFFTTRMGQGGSGLGLAILMNLTRDALGGDVSVASKPGHGVQFTFRIPRIAPVRQAEHPAPPEHPAIS